ncbi:MAG: flavodoxin family protein [Methanoregula sp.]|nr:flavodoxin family protein [Methanoregula sp.]
MKIVVLMGSPRKGNTFRACEEFREHLQKICPAEFEYIWLKDARIEPCKGCFVCFPHGEDKCPNRDDDVHVIEQKMLDADGVIFASPVYSSNVTGQMKTFIDRISYTGHRPRFFGKKAFFLVTTGILGAGDVLKYMKKIAWSWGFECAGTTGLITPNGAVPRYRAEINTKLLRKGAKNFSAGLLQTTKRSPGIMDMVLFHAGRGANSQLEKVSPADYQYWKTRGWHSPDVEYFIDVPVNPLYRAFGKIVEMLVKRQVRKDLIHLT